MKKCVMFSFLVLFALVVGLSATKSHDLLTGNSQLSHSDFGFLLIHSKILLAGKNETFCLVLHDVPLPTKALIDLKISKKHSTLSKVIQKELSCFEFPVPHMPNQKSPGEELVGQLQLQMQINGSIQSARNYERILIQPQLDVTLMETDRHYYKEGDLVRIRIIVLNYDLKPSVKKQPIRNVKIINPSGFIVNVWENPQVQLGLCQLEYKLAEQTTLGKWKIEANGIYKTFYVKTYTLPRFKIEIDAPKTIYVKSTKITFHICVKYSHGHFLKGQAFVKITYNHLSHYSTSKLSKLVNGCTDIELANKELNLSSSREDLRDSAMNALVTVTEQGTNQIETETFTIASKKEPFSLKFSTEKPFFQPGIPYKGVLKITDAILPTKHNYASICYQLSWKEAWNLKPEECETLKFDENGLIYFSVFPFKENVVEVKFTAKSSNYSEVLAQPLILSRWFAQSSRSLVVEKNLRASLVPCQAELSFKVFYTTNKIKHGDNITFFYLLKSRNDILETKKITRKPQKLLIKFKDELKNIIGTNNKYTKADNSMDWFDINLKLPEKVFTKAQLLVFYFNRGEIISNTLNIRLEKCLPNTVSANWQEPEIKPGAVGTLSIKASPNSLCAIGSVDRVTDYLTRNKHLNTYNILGQMRQGREFPLRSNRLNCLQNHEGKQAHSDPVSLGENLEDLQRKKRSYSKVHHENYDTFEILNDIGLGVITNYKMIFKPCLNEDLAPRYYQVSTEDNEILGHSALIRSYFPETWLWDLIYLGDSGSARFSQRSPHSITTWDTNVVCVNKNQGVGVLPLSANLTVFQPFYVEIIASEVVKRYEVLSVQVAVFNYLSYGLPVTVTLTTALDFIHTPPKNILNICIPANDMKTHTFHLKATRLGKENLMVRAETKISHNSFVCGSKHIALSKDTSDTVIKEIQVVSEGYLVERTKSVLLCGLDVTNNLTWNVDISEDAIEDSESAQVILNTDLMGPTIQHLERFLKIPTGCGEQVMATMAPNLYVLKYTNSNKKLSSSLRQRTIKNLKIGYQRILDYLHTDGSFSAFGYHDPAGSMFLTSFVVRTLQQAKEFIFIDDKVITKATEWILMHQLENGCFSAVSHVFQDMGGTSSENSTAALTAYVIISLLEAKVEVSDVVRMNAMYCIRGQRNPDKYTLAISTYALFLLGWGSEATQGLQKLVDSANKEGNLMWWNSESGSSTTNIEISGYVLMSLMVQITNDNLIHASSVVRWLGTQRGSQGGFLSTQDTVVALDAISRYANVVKGRDPELSILISNGKEAEKVIFSPKESLKTKQVVFKDVGRRIKLSAIGKGCLLAQLLISYNMMRPINNEMFDLKVEVQPVSNIDKCSITKIVLCVQSKMKLSNMVVLEVALPSGYEPDRTSLHQLIMKNNSKVKKFEEFEKRVVLYFTELVDQTECVSFDMNENAIVADQTNATVSLYDYYNPERKVVTSYKLHKCSSNDISVDGDLSVAEKNKDALQSEVDAMQAEDLRVLSAPIGLNQDFVNMDIEMATPSGMEGNAPVFVKPGAFSKVKHREQDDMNNNYSQ